MNSNPERLTEPQMSAFLARHDLPAAFRQTADEHYLPLVRWLGDLRTAGTPLMLAINGAQGTGKSTLADYIRLATHSAFGWNCAVLSIDDFYLTRAERETLAHRVHPLFLTRGVPGTHDTAMLAGTLDRLGQLPAGERVLLPRFDKATDDRAPEAGWTPVSGPLDLVVLEGWCVGSVPQSPAALEQPVNALERHEDPEAVWRSYANARLRADYVPLFSRFDALVVLAAPRFEAVFRWRLEQERKLAATRSGGAAVMDDRQLARFIRFYERITRHDLETLPAAADVVMTLNEDHAVTDSRYRARP